MYWYYLPVPIDTSGTIAVLDSKDKLSRKEDR
jgi:hypothetical protein